MELQKIGIEKIKMYALGILKEFDFICKKNNLKYSIAYGTLLGAIRHKGFIPWDDDIDVIMPREDYEQLMSLKYKTDRYEVKSYRYTKGYYYEFSKMVDHYTKIKEKNRCDRNMGVFIDIFPMDYVPSKNILQSKMYLAQKDKTMVLRLGSDFRNTTNNKIMLIPKVIFRVLILPFRKSLIYKYEKKIINQKHKSNGWTAGFIIGNKKDYFPSSIWDSLIEIKFEDLIVSCIKDYDNYLSRLYGDYMTPPPLEEQVTHHSFVAYEIIK